MNLNILCKLLSFDYQQIMFMAVSVLNPFKLKQYVRHHPELKLDQERVQRVCGRRWMRFFAANTCVPISVCMYVCIRIHVYICRMYINVYKYIRTNTNRYKLNLSGFHDPARP